MKKFIVYLFVGLLCANPVFASNDALYTARVSVDVTASNSAAARETAMRDANRRALLTIAGKVTTEEGVNKFSSLTNEQILNFIKETSVISEKASTTRYIATLSILANEDLIKGYLEEQGIPIALDEAKTAVIIPVYRQTSSSSPLLWEGDNLWANEWKNKLIKKGMVSFKGAPQNLANFINTEEALRLDGIALSQVSQYTQTRDIYVAELIGNGDTYSINILSYKDGPLGSLSADNMSDAVTKTVTKISDSIKKQSIAQGSYKANFTVLYNFQNLKDWIETEKKLKNVPYVNNIEISAMGDKKVQFKILFSGSRENLFRSLRKEFLELKENGNFYILTKI